MELADVDRCSCFIKSSMGRDENAEEDDVEQNEECDVKRDEAVTLLVAGE